MKEVIKIFKQIQETSSTNDKKAIIAANKDNELFKKCLVFLLDGNVITGISAKKIKKKVIKNEYILLTFEDVMKYLAQNNTGISNKKLKKNIEMTNHIDVICDFEDIMEYLKINNSGRDSDISIVQGFIANQSEEDREFYEQMITKSFRLGADSKVVNSVNHSLIPTFEI